MYYNKKHAKIVEVRGDNYTYIGSYEVNEVMKDSNTPRKVSKPYIRVKCPYCKKEYDIRIDGFKNNAKCTYCCNEYKNSFAYHIEQELKLNLCDVWDSEKNVVNPNYIYKSSNQKVWIKCTNKETNPFNGISKNKYHDSYTVRCSDYSRGDRCPFCSLKGDKIHKFDSFMYWAINVIDKDFESKYVSDKNTINLWKISIQSKYKGVFKCQEKEYHDDYESSCLDFYRKYKEGTFNKCPQCLHKSGKIHPKDSFGALCPEKAKYWNYELNKLSPFEVSLYTEKEFWFYCEDCKRPFKRRMSKVNRTDYKQNITCINCTIKSRLEIKTKDVLDKYKIKYETQKKFNNLIGLKHGNLSYDFYLPDYNILIECQGEQHEHYVKGLQETEEDFLKQQEHDRRKFNYALEHNYIPMEIWYWDYDNIEEILIRELGLH